MSRNEIRWSKKVFDTFIEEGMLNDFQIELMKSRIKGDTVKYQAIVLFHVSESTIHREIKKLKDLYDEIQKQHPDDMPVRKNSKQEEYMDNN